ncbi:MAG: DUF4346 domain-containing protein [Candidatus Nanoarchaeia archaeon]
MSLYSTSQEKDSIKEVQASYDSLKEWKYDPKGYFLIRINKETQEIEVGHCRRNNEVEITIKGKHPEEIYNTIVREDKLNLISLKEHAAYLGMELEKAYVALLLGLTYIQDEDLTFPGIKKNYTLTSEDKQVLELIKLEKKNLTEVERESKIPKNKLKMIYIKLHQLELIKLEKKWDTTLNDEIWTAETQ